MSVSPAIPDGNPRSGPREALRPRFLTVSQIVLVRLRFLLALVAVLLVVGYWDTVRNYWDRFTRPAGNAAAAVSLDTEYWCPMCPGVLSEWPGKCPVCNMALVRRKKGEAVPLPDGVVARMQLSPYRIQLAGIATSAVEYRPLVRTLALAGFVERETQYGKPQRQVIVPTEVFERDLAWVAEGIPVEATSDARPGREFRGTVAELGRQISQDTRGLKMRVAIDDPAGELLPGMLVSVAVRSPLARSGVCRTAWADRWRDGVTADRVVRSLVAPLAVSGGDAETLLRSAAEIALLRRDLVLAVPESAVVDTGTRRVVYRESMPGTFDGVEVTLGGRCGEFFPVLRGLEFGDRVVTEGALLIDAETRLNPSIAASYFGADRRSADSPPAERAAGLAPAAPTDGDRELIKRQKRCPVTGEPLGSMGSPVRVDVAGRAVFVCCKACEPALKKDPGKYLARLNKQ